MLGTVHALYLQNRTWHSTLYMLRSCMFMPMFMPVGAILDILVSQYLLHTSLQVSVLAPPTAPIEPLPQRFISSLLGIYCTSYVQSPKRRTQYRWGSFSSFHHCSLLGEKTKSSARHGFEALFYSWNCKSVDNNHLTARIKNLKS